MMIIGNSRFFKGRVMRKYKKGILNIIIFSIAGLLLFPVTAEGEEMKSWKDELSIIQEGKASTIEKDGISWSLAKIRMTDRMHGLEIYYYLRSNYKEAGYLWDAFSGGTKDYYYFSHDHTTKSEDGDYLPKGRVYIKEDYLYYLEGINVTEENRESVYEEIENFEKEVLGGTPNGFRMFDEDLYWQDHEERLTYSEDMKNSCLEIRGRNTVWFDENHSYFGLLKKAEYSLQISEKLPEMRVSFCLKKEIPKAGYQEEIPFDDTCHKETYIMEIVNAENGELIHGDEVELCIDTLDTISFEDLNGDKYLDIILSYPKRNGSGFEEENIFLWEWKQIAAIGSDNTGTSRIVKKGDSLWTIAEEIYFKGQRYQDIYEKNKEIIGDNPSLIFEGTELILP